MTTPAPAPRPPSNTAALVVLAVVFCFTLGIVAAVHIFSRDGSDTTALVQTIIGTLGPTLAVVVVLVQVRAGQQVAEQRMDQTEAKVDTIATDTHRLTNGLLDAKVRAGVADVLHPDLVDPAADRLLDRDRQVRQAGDPDVDLPEDRPLSSAEVDKMRGH